MMDIGDRDDGRDGLVKWPFYLSALFIFVLIIGFAYLHFEKTGTLDQWQIVTCILGSGLASILVFLPYLIDRFLFLVFDPVNRKDEELIRKVFFDLKEMRGELDALSVKIDKVPTLVDKILSDAAKPGDDPAIGKLNTELEETREELGDKLKRLEELAEQTPLLPEPDPGIAQANDAISKLASALKSLGKQLDTLQSSVSELPTEFHTPAPAAQPPEMVASAPEPEPEEEVIAEEEEDEPGKMESPDDSDDPEEEDTEEAEEPAEEDSDEEGEEEEVDEPEAEEDLQEESDEDEGSIETVEEDGDDLEETEDSDTESEPEEEAQPDEEPEEEETLSEESAEEDGEEDEGEPAGSGELDLGLPDPAETLRKVDALLAGESTAPPPEPTKEEAPKPKPGGVTSVVANVMIGIGNKPFLRGEGPGLSWDEGVPMNFVEIGKWAWSPTRKNATLTVQVYRNDEDPDQGGKYEVKPGEKFEITPDFG